MSLSQTEAQSLTIRPYIESDLTLLLDCWEKADKLAHPFLPEAFHNKVRKDIVDLYLPNTETWIAELDGTLIGYISLIENEVGGLFLDPAFHGRRIGKALMDKARALHGSLDVEVFKNNTIGRAFYERYGFELIEEKLHKETGQTLLRMRLQ